MLITIKKVKDKYYRVFADEKEIGIFHEKTLNKLKIQDKKEYGPEYIKKFELIKKIKLAKKKAEDILNYRDHSEKELYEKLIKHTEKEIANYVIKYMKKRGIVDDFKYATNLAQKLIFKKNKGKNLAILEITKKGIDKDLARSVVLQIDCDFVEQIKTLISIKHKENLKDYESKKKLISSLLRRGYCYSDIDSAIKFFIEK